MTRIETLQQYLHENPDDNFLQHALALEYVKLGNDAEARRMFETILLRDEMYTGSYYHLARLLERNGDTAEAIKVYEKGMAMCKQSGDQHAYNELQAAYEDLVF